MSLPPGARITGMWCQACLFTWILRIHVDSGPHACTTYSLLTKLSPHPQVCSADCSDWSAPTPLTQEIFSAAPVHRGRLFCVENVPYGVRQVFLKTYLFLLFVYKRFCLRVYLCTVCVQCPQRPEAGIRSSDSCGHHEGAGNRAWILCQSSECSWLLNHLSTLSVILHELQLPWSTATALGPLRRGSQSSHIFQAWTFYTDQSIHSQ